MARLAHCRAPRVHIGRPLQGARPFSRARASAVCRSIPE
ncbi:hypothetical protein SALB1_2731 [Salinisphaera sp. LB1]|nr:hypothetical protein SALB1_2731 [Salinisphaera sp. LB1]